MYTHTVAGCAQKGSFFPCAFVVFLLLGRRRSSSVSYTPAQLFSLPDLLHPQPTLLFCEWGRCCVVSFCPTPALRCPLGDKRPGPSRASVFVVSPCALCLSFPSPPPPRKKDTCVSHTVPLKSNLCGMRRRPPCRFGDPDPPWSLLVGSAMPCQYGRDPLLWPHPHLRPAGKGMEGKGRGGTHSLVRYAPAPWIPRPIMVLPSSLAHPPSCHSPTHPLHAPTRTHRPGYVIRHPPHPQDEDAGLPAAPDLSPLAGYLRLAGGLHGLCCRHAARGPVDTLLLHHRGVSVQAGEGPAAGGGVQRGGAAALPGNLRPRYVRARLLATTSHAHNALTTTLAHVYPGIGEVGLRLQHKGKRRAVVSEIYLVDEAGLLRPESLDLHTEGTMHFRTSTKGTSTPCGHVHGCLGRGGGGRDSCGVSLLSRSFGWYTPVVPFPSPPPTPQTMRSRLSAPKTSDHQSRT